MKGDDKQIWLKNFGDYLRDLRKAKGWSLSDLEAYSGVDTSNLSQIENGLRDASASTLRKLAKALETDLVIIHN